jgi:hypothetical protein
MFTPENFRPATQASEQAVQPSTAHQEVHQLMAQISGSKQQSDNLQITNETLDLSHNSKLFDSVHQRSEYHNILPPEFPTHGLKLPDDASKTTDDFLRQVHLMETKQHHPSHENQPNFQPLEGKQADDAIAAIKQQLAFQHMMEELAKALHGAPENSVERHGKHGDSHGAKKYSDDWKGGCEEVMDGWTKAFAQLGANIHFPNKALDRAWTDLNEDIKDALHNLKDIINSGGKLGMQELTHLLNKTCTDIVKFCQIDPKNPINDALHKIPLLFPKLLDVCLGKLKGPELAEYLHEVHKTTHEVAEAGRQHRDIAQSNEPSHKVLPIVELYEYDGKRMVS